MKILRAFIFSALIACSSSTSPSLQIAGSYTLTRANGSALPAPYTAPIYGSVVASSGSGTIGNDGSVSVTVKTDARPGAPNATWNVVGVVTQEATGYHFAFSDGSTATGTYSGGKFTVVYPPNTLVFTRQ